MEAGKGSLSAMGSGLQRAAHVREDPPPWVFEDALAGQLLDAAEAAELEAEMAAWPPVVRRALRVSHAVRVRLAEDVAAAGLAAGRRHYVLLGAGLDTFAWRHPGPASSWSGKSITRTPGPGSARRCGGPGWPNPPTSGSWPRTCRR